MSDNGRITWTNAKRKLSDLIPWPRNPRQIKKSQVERLQESIDLFGQVDVIAIGPGNEIYNGHQRLKSWADKYGDIEVDVRVSNRELTEKEREKLTVFLHKGAAGEWDFDVLANEFDVDDLLDWGFEEHDLDLDMWGVEPEDDPGAQIDRAEELREKWGVESGQLWKMGEHRLICGDCTDADVVKRILDIQPELMVTDPPYGVEYDANWRNEAAEKGQISHAASRVGVVHNDNRSDWSDSYKLFSGDVAYIWSPGGDQMIEFGLSIRESGFNIRNVIIWRKQTHVISRGHYHIQHEPLWYAVRKNKTASWIGDRSQVSVWDINWDENIEGGHSTQKPLECMEHPIRNHEGTVYDPFLGSGTTLIACERLGRKCRAVEISPAYCAVAIQRWVDMTGGEPELVT